MIYNAQCTIYIIYIYIAAKPEFVSRLSCILYRVYYIAYFRVAGWRGMGLGRMYFSGA